MRVTLGLNTTISSNWPALIHFLICRGWTDRRLATSRTVSQSGSGTLIDPNQISLIFMLYWASTCFFFHLYSGVLKPLTSSTTRREPPKQAWLYWKSAT